MGAVILTKTIMCRWLSDPSFRVVRVKKHDAVGRGIYCRWTPIPGFDMSCRHSVDTKNPHDLKYFIHWDYGTIVY